MPEWSKGKTILNLDIKDVPLEVMADFIEKEKPVNVMYTVHKPVRPATISTENRMRCFLLV